MKELKNTIICPNCETEFDSGFKFCPECGQQNKGFNLNLSHFIKDFLSANFNIESKLLLTLGLLITKPGFLTREYLCGKRTKYVTPVRLYLIISFIYFFILAISPQNNWKSDNSDVVIANDTTIVYDQQVVDSINQAEPNKSTINSTMDNDSISDLESFVIKKSKKFNSKEGRRIFNEQFRKNTSIGMFILIPFTALLLFLIFHKGTYYVQHLVFSLHVQSVIFLLLIFHSLLENIITGDAFDGTVSILMIVIPYLWLKKYYKISYFKALWKMLIFMTGYTALLIIVFILIFSVSFLTIDGVSL